MDTAEAERRLAAAVAERDATKATAEAARQHLYEVVREVSAGSAMKQVEIARATGWTREHVRKIVNPDEE